MFIYLLVLLVILAITLIFSPIKGAQKQSLKSLFFALSALLSTAIIFVPAFIFVVIPLGILALRAAYFSFSNKQGMPLIFKIVSVVSMCIALFSMFIALSGNHLIDWVEKYL